MKKLIDGQVIASAEILAKISKGNLDANLVVTPIKKLLEQVVGLKAACTGKEQNKVSND